ALPVSYENHPLLKVEGKEEQNRTTLEPLLQSGTKLLIEDNSFLQSNQSPSKLSPSSTSLSPKRTRSISQSMQSSSPQKFDLSKSETSANMSICLRSSTTTVQQSQQETRTRTISSTGSSSITKFENNNDDDSPSSRTRRSSFRQTSKTAPSITNSDTCIVSLDHTVVNMNSVEENTNASSSRSTSRASSETKLDFIQPLTSQSANSQITDTTPDSSESSRDTTIETVPLHLKSISSDVKPKTSSMTSTSMMTRRSLIRSSESHNNDETISFNLSASIDEKFSAFSMLEPKSWKSYAVDIMRSILSQKSGYIFLHPVTDEIAPNYHKLVKKPSDLNTIRKRLESGEISSIREFQVDIMLMFINAIKYNPPTHRVHRTAKQVFHRILPQFETIPDVHFPKSFNMFDQLLLGSSSRSESLQNVLIKEQSRSSDHLQQPPSKRRRLR
ncbi:unnamed protein product, partial [Didymodactylos carnosus]